MASPANWSHGQLHLECLAWLETGRLNLWLLLDESGGLSLRAAAARGPSAGKHNTLGD